MSTNPGHTLWLGSAGTATAFGVARSVRSAWGPAVRIVAADVNPPHLVAAAALADAAEQVPYVADEEAFVAALSDGLTRHAVDTYVPILVDEIALAARLRQASLLPAGVSILAPAAHAAALCTDKLALAEWLRAHDIPSPPTVLAAEAVWWPEGVVVKSRGGEGSRNVDVLGGPDALPHAHARGADAVAQRRCEPPEVTVDAFRSLDGAVFATICRERVEVKAGVSTKARAFRDPGLEGIVRRVAEELDLRGPACVQAMRGTGGWEITDVNPRCGGGSPLSTAVGFDVAAAALADLWGEDPLRHLREFTGEAWIVRHHEELVRLST